MYYENDQFLKNKYHRWYRSIIENALLRTSTDAYFERHHIIPKCFGGSNDRSNLVKLSYREHFICHLLLCRFTFGVGKQKMSYAMWRMAHPRKHLTISSLQYQIAKSLVAENNKTHYLLGVPKTEAHKAALRKPKPITFLQNGINNHNFKGYYHTPWGRFDSSAQAAKAAPMPIPSTTIITLCKQYADRPMKKKSKWAPVGVPLRSLGYYFEEGIKTCAC